MTVKQRFFDRVDITEGCWHWRGSLTHNGYGQFSIRLKNHRAHRVIWEWANGPIPEGLQLDHLCRVRDCVNPAHLEAVTPRVNEIATPASIPTRVPTAYHMMFAPHVLLADQSINNRCDSSRAGSGSVGTRTSSQPEPEAAS